jgi:hypothetical protein
MLTTSVASLRCGGQHHRNEWTTSSGTAGQLARNTQQVGHLEISPPKWRLAAEIHVRLVWSLDPKLLKNILNCCLDQIREDAKKQTGEEERSVP